MHRKDSTCAQKRQQNCVRALLEAVDLVLDVLGVRVDGRRDDLGEVVGEEIGRVEARVARPIPPALPVFGTTGKEAEATGTARAGKLTQVSFAVDQHSAAAPAVVSARTTRQSHADSTSRRQRRTHRKVTSRRRDVAR